MPDKTDLLELHRQHQAGQEKYTYFLLTAAGAAIGFAVQKADGMTLSWWLSPAALAILFWGISFYFGCKNLIWVQTYIYSNYSLLQLMLGAHPDQPPHPELTDIAISDVRKAISHNVGKAQFYGIWQFRMLIVGALFFIGWRLAEMIRLTYWA
ncbi:hypothetical protein ACH50O_06670 [Methylomonas sp. 2BW1-5-20]|uniref:hypothetical protein n=1 Tax=Methylomonas sp. 2BW1-5-20 TaxID=3376686 RepID=UPI0040512010